MQRDHRPGKWEFNPGEPPGPERFIRPALAALAILAFTAVIAGLIVASHSNAPVARGSSSANKPSVVLIVTDDQRWDTLKYMPIVRKDLLAHGVDFKNAFVTNPLCCPSRASILTGQYSHTTGVYDNNGPQGGFRSFNDGGTVATWMDADYSTALFGKYLNNYEAAARRGVVPLGWDHWVAFFREGYYGYKLNIDGTLRSFDGHNAQQYSTDLLANDASQFIRTTKGPLFVYFAPAAPHAPAIPAKQDTHAFRNLKPWRGAAFNEADMSDKPSWAQHLQPMAASNIRKIDQFRLDQLRTLQSVDRAVGQIVDALQATGRLQNTMIIFTSDNGYVWGEHRFTGKNVPWEESIRVPLIVRYDPLTPKPSNDYNLVTNIDFTPTIMDLAGEQGPKADGMSFLPLLRNSQAHWRDAFLVEHWAAQRSDRIPTYCAVRTQRYMYVHYFWGTDELYDLQRDPHEMQNLIGDPKMAGVLGELQRKETQLCNPPPPNSGASALLHR